MSDFYAEFIKQQEQQELVQETSIDEAKRKLGGPHRSLDDWRRREESSQEEEDYSIELRENGCEVSICRKVKR
jgi:hypothetical protein